MDINGNSEGISPEQAIELDEAVEKTQYQQADNNNTNFNGSLTLNGSPISGGGNPFDQDLNTFDSPQFVSMEMENNILFRDPIAGSEMILVSQNGLHKIATSAGSGPNNNLTIETDELRLEANLNLSTQVAGNLTENIAANKTVLINANKIETIVASNQITASSHIINGPVTFSGQVSGGIFNATALRNLQNASSLTLQSASQLTIGAGTSTQILSPTIQINAPVITTNSDITTTQTIFTNPQQFITKDYVDNALPLPQTLQDAYTNGNTIVTSGGNPINILGTEGLEVNNNSVITTKTSFTDPQEFVSKSYVDNNSGSSTFSYFRGSAGASATVFEDAYMKFIWDATNKQPKFSMKIQPSGSWVDGGIQLTHEPLTQEFITNVDDISTALLSELYFTDTGSRNSAFDMSNYGNLATTWICPESVDTSYPSYLCKWIMGSSTGSLSVSIETFSI